VKQHKKFTYLAARLQLGPNTQNIDMKVGKTSSQAAQ